jgi:hypothetical protein
MTSKARIVFNTNGYQNPSGRQNKSTNRRTFEGRTGFGFEEWLLNNQFKLNDYHYGFIQCFKHPNQFENHYDQLELYSYSNRTASIVLKLHDVHVLDNASRNTAFNQYGNLGLTNLMRNDLLQLGLQNQEFEDSILNAENFINIKFLNSELLAIPFKTIDFKYNNLI